MDLSENTVIALEPLFVGIARAANRGDVVPVDNVERNGWTDQVAAHGTPEAVAALGFDPYQPGEVVSADDSTPPTFNTDASIDRIKEYVGGSYERAGEVLAAEQAKPEPRATLVEWLQKVQPA